MQGFPWGLLAWVLALAVVVFVLTRAAEWNRRRVLEKASSAYTPEQYEEVAADLLDEIKALSANRHTQVETVRWLRSAGLNQGEQFYLLGMLFEARVIFPIVQYVNLGGRITKWMDDALCTPQTNVVLSDRDWERMVHGEKAGIEIVAETIGIVDLSNRKSVKKKEVVMGDKFENVSNATIVNRSVVTGTVSSLLSSGREDEARALNRLLEEVERSGSTEAGEMVESFSEELARPNPRRSTLKNLWTGLVSALPHLSKMVEITKGFEDILR